MVKKIKVLVVDDSAFMRKVISDMIKKDASLELVGTARNGLDALKKVTELNPDVITLDVEMPKMNGLEALVEIMKIKPTPVIMLSALTQKGAEITISALSKGAVDFVAKPGGSISLNINEVEKDIIKKIKMASGVTMKKMIFPRKNVVNSVEKTKPSPTITKSPCNFDFPVVLIGTSTGGPKALHQVIESLPADLNAGVLVVQHMPAGFTKSLAQRLDKLTPLKVKEAEDGEEIKKNHIYIAPGDFHMEVELKNCKLFINLHQGPLVTGHRPSVDALFTSVAQLNFKKIVGVIMTGMGQDGTKGISQLKKVQNCYTIAEAEETCVVFGMPKSAIEAGVIDKVVPLHAISSEIMAALRSMR